MRARVTTRQLPNGRLANSARVCPMVTRVRGLLRQPSLYFTADAIGEASRRLLVAVSLDLNCARLAEAPERRDVVTDESARSVRLENDLQARTRCLCEALQRVGRRTDLTALDARDVRLRRLHPPRQLRLR